MPDTLINPLSAIQIHISKLDEIDHLDKYDVFVIADNVGENEYLTKKITYDTLSSTLLEDIRTYPDITLIGEYKISNGKPFNIKTSTIEHNKNNDGTIALNIDYFQKFVLGEIYKLSTELYGTSTEYPYSHVPSTIGQIVTSQRLNSLEAMKKTYGQNTNWEQINRFIIGVGPNIANTTDKYGSLKSGEVNYTVGFTTGEKSVKLDENQIPKHNHKFRADTCTFTMTWYLSWILEDIDMSEHESGVQFYPTSALKKAEHKYAYDNNLWQVDIASLTDMHAMFHGQGSISTKDFGATLESDVWNFDTGQKVNSNVSSHNNMPPFIIEYVWRRTS